MIERPKLSIAGILLSPPLCASLLLASITLFRILAAQPVPQVERYHARVASVIDRFPFRIGNYVGADAELSKPAVELLKPNRIIQRTFVNIGTGLAFSIVIAHCKDVRDMVGHYPPVCYPAHGWRLTRSSPIELTASDMTTIPAMRYRLTRSTSGVDRTLDLVNFFVVPRPLARFAPDMDALNALAVNSRERLLGSAQVQIIVPEGLPDAELSPFLSEVLSALKPTIDAVADGAVDG